MFGSRIGAILAVVVAMSGCSSTAPHEHASMASAVTFGDPWATSAEMGMAAVFGTFTNGCLLYTSDAADE